MSFKCMRRSLRYLAGVCSLRAALRSRGNICELEHGPMSEMVKYSIVTLLLEISLLLLSVLGMFNIDII